MSDPSFDPGQPEHETGVEPPERSVEWWEARYAAGDIPWDTGVTPPEVVGLVESGKVQNGWALDLGCGSGVTSRYLATKGFRVIGLDLSLLALQKAAAQAISQGLRCSFLRASVADLGWLRVRATLVVDVGCFHSLSGPARLSYVRSLAERVVSGGYYLLYAFIKAPASSASAEENGPSLSLRDIAAFAPWFVLRATSHGDDRGRASGWFLMERV